ncbi:hypothetical protein [Deinococcus marmoris]|uniref:hypothetical protein n=1 Tax=Deinococcus marmoris TaxID=249408 RepID=UPI00158C8D56|nr:hypothetical protein [Deinococcus marmoris]
MRNLTKFVLTCLILILSTTSHATSDTPVATDGVSAAAPGEGPVAITWPPIWWPGGE